MCAAGKLGARCAFSSDMLFHSLRARARREQERVRNLHLCLSVWRGGADSADPYKDKEAAEEKGIRDGAPLAFALCRVRLNQHQQWTVEPRPNKGEGAVRIRSASQPELCVSVPPVHYRMRRLSQDE